MSRGRTAWSRSVRSHVVHTIEDPDTPVGGEVLRLVAVPGEIDAGGK